MVATTTHARALVICRPSHRMVEYQVRNDRGYSALALASDFERAQVARLLIVAGAKIESRDHRGYTPLMHASREVIKVTFDPINYKEIGEVS